MVKLYNYMVWQLLYNVLRGISSMKIKSDFVTNSSSTSFIIAMESDFVDKVEFVKKLNECLEEIDQKSGWQEQPDPQPSVDVDDVEKVSSNLFVMEGVVPYFSSYDNLPKHIRNLVLDYMNDHDSLAKFGIKNLEFEIKDKNEPQNK